VISYDDVVKKLKSLLISDLFVEQPEHAIGLDDGLQSVLGVDSLGFLELKLLCEQHFGVAIADREFNDTNFSSVRRIADLVMRLRESAAA
jgi:acyl carrier protein